MQSPTPLWLAAGMLDRPLTDGHTRHLPAMLSDFGLHFSPCSFEVRRWFTLWLQWILCGEFLLVWAFESWEESKVLSIKLQKLGTSGVGFSSLWCWWDPWQKKLEDRFSLAYSSKRIPITAGKQRELGFWVKLRVDSHSNRSSKLAPPPLPMLPASKNSTAGQEPNVKTHSLLGDTSHSTFLILFPPTLRSFSDCGSLWLEWKPKGLIVLWGQVYSSVCLCLHSAELLSGLETTLFRGQKPLCLF